MAPDGGGNAVGLQLSTNVVDQVGGARQAADGVHQANGVIERSGIWWGARVSLRGIFVLFTARMVLL